VYLENVNDTVIADIAAEGPREVAAVSFDDCDNVARDNVVPGGEISAPYEIQTESSFQTNGGKAVIDSTRTAVTVQQNLAGTPDEEDISVTPTGPLGDATSWYVADAATTTFEIHVDATPGQDVPFGWTASI